MKFKYTLGIDQSKATFNFCLMNASYQILWEGKQDNTPDAIFAFITELVDFPDLNGLDSVGLCLEHTGIYTNHLIRCWSTRGGQLSLIPASKISTSLAGKKGWDEKNDPIDARRVAEYGIRFHDKLRIWKMKSQTLTQIRALHNQRERLIKARTMLVTPLGESKVFDSVSLSQSVEEACQPALQGIEQALKQTEAQIKALIDADPHLKELFDLITSVSGVGPVTARAFIIATEGFTKFAPNQAKKFARNSGVVLLDHESGSSVKRKKRCSKKSDKKMRTLLTLCASSLVGGKTELAQYYERKIAEGKDPLVVINAIRNKIILRVFAVVRKGTMYQKNLNLLT